MLGLQSIRGRFPSIRSECARRALGEKSQRWETVFFFDNSSHDARFQKIVNQKPLRPEKDRYGYGVRRGAPAPPLDKKFPIAGFDAQGCGPNGRGRAFQSRPICARRRRVFYADWAHPISGFGPSERPQAFAGASLARAFLCAGGGGGAPLIADVLPARRAQIATGLLPPRNGTLGGFAEPRGCGQDGA